MSSVPAGYEWLLIRSLIICYLDHVSPQGHSVVYVVFLCTGGCINFAFVFGEAINLSKRQRICHMHAQFIAWRNTRRDCVGRLVILLYWGLYCGDQFTYLLGISNRWQRPKIHYMRDTNIYIQQNNMLLPCTYGQDIWPLNTSNKRTHLYRNNK